MRCFKSYKECKKKNAPNRKRLAHSKDFLRAVRKAKRRIRKLTKKLLSSTKIGKLSTGCITAMSIPGLDGDFMIDELTQLLFKDLVTK